MLPTRPAGGSPGDIAPDAVIVVEAINRIGADLVIDRTTYRLAFRDGVAIGLDGRCQLLRTQAARA
jgi:Arc/MetJ family transcription regulator